MDEKFKTAITKASEILVNCPQALTVVLKREEGMHFYAFADNTPTARKVRKEVAAVLNELWQSGAYNYEQIADALRVKELDITALLDEQFRSKTGLK